jgi:hypothetical protein
MQRESVMAKLVPVRHESQGKEEPPGLMARGYFERFGKAKGYVEVKDEAAVAAAETASAIEPVGDSAPAPAGGRGRRS